MRIAGMIATFFVLIAVVIGIIFLSDTLGFSFSVLLEILIPVLVGVAILCVAFIYFGKWSVRKLNEANRESSSSEPPEPKK